MNFLFVANEHQKEELLQSKDFSDVHAEFISHFQTVDSGKFDALFFLDGDFSLLEPFDKIKIPVIINSVSQTLTDLKTPDNYSRINAWPGFLGCSISEVAGKKIAAVKTIFDRINWRFREVEDVPGFVGARVISMVINEAYFALEEDLASIRDIDLAMKNGTNYPYGPFEWVDKIGIHKIYELLTKLSVTGTRYDVAPLLVKRMNEKETQI